MLAPLIARKQGEINYRQYLKAVLAYALIGVGLIALFAAAFIQIWITFGVIPACLASGVVLLGSGFLCLQNVKGVEETQSVTHAEVEDDIIGKYLPDIVKNDPTVSGVIDKVHANPVASLVGATAIGLWLAHEIFGD